MPLNGIAGVEISLGAPLPCEPYADCTDAGAFVLVDRTHHGTVAAGMITDLQRDIGAPVAPDHEGRAAQKGQTALTVWLHGDDPARRSALLERLDGALFAQGLHTYRLPRSLPGGLGPEALLPLFLDAGLVVLADSEAPAPAPLPAGPLLARPVADDDEALLDELIHEVLAHQPGVS